MDLIQNRVQNMGPIAGKTAQTQFMLLFHTRFTLNAFLSDAECSRKYTEEAILISGEISHIHIKHMRW